MYLREGLKSMEKKIVKVPIDSYAPIESSIANLTRLILENL